MATNGGNIAVERRLAEEILRLETTERADEMEKTQPPRADARRTTVVEEPRPAGHEAADIRELALAPLVDRVAYGFAKVLVFAMKELELHIAKETRAVGEDVGRRLDTLQASFQELTGAVSDLRASSAAVREKCDRLAADTTALRESEARQDAELAAIRTDAQETSATLSKRIDEETASARTEAKETSAALSQRIDTETASLRESDARVEADVAALRSETKEVAAAASERIGALSKELEVHQEDLAAIKSALGGFTTRVDSLVERLDRQAEALHSMYTTYSQRESELEQLVEGLTRLRSFPAPAPASRL